MMFQFHGLIFECYQQLQTKHASKAWQQCYYVWP